MRDYYDILNVDKNANDNDIKKAYRKVAMKYHPDKNPGDKASEEKFKEAAEAYSVLSDQEKKNRYDQMGHQQYQQFGSQGQGFSGGINVEDISLGMGSDSRIGSRFLRAGPAYGGSCFPKDTKGLISAADKYKVNLSVVKSVIKSNHDRVNLLTYKIHKILGSNLKNKKISFLGVTFKPNTDDMRDSTSLKMIPYLSKKGAIINYYDPSGEKNEFRKIKNCYYKNNIKNNCNNSDLVILLTEWDEFKTIDFKKIVKNNRFKVYDLRNLYNPEEMKRNRIKYYSVGRPDTK